MRDEHACLTIGCRGRHLGLQGTSKQENCGECIMKRSMICTSQQIFWRENLNERDNLESLDVQKRIILKGGCKKGGGGIYMAGDRYR